MYKIKNAFLEQRTEVVDLLRGWDSIIFTKDKAFKIFSFVNLHKLQCCPPGVLWTEVLEVLLSPEQRLSLSSPLCGDCFTTWTRQWDNDYSREWLSLQSFHCINMPFLNQAEQTLHELLLFAWEKLITRADQERCFNHNKYTCFCETQLFMSFFIKSSMFWLLDFLLEFTFQ